MAFAANLFNPVELNQTKPALEAFVFGLVELEKSSTVLGFFRAHDTGRMGRFKRLMSDFIDLMKRLKMVLGTFKYDEPHVVAQACLEIMVLLIHPG